MNENIRKFVKFEDPNKPHKKVVKSLISLPFLFSPFIYMFLFFGSTVNWLFYSIIPFAVIGLIWGIVLLHKIESKRKQFYFFCGIMKILFCFVMLNFNFAILEGVFKLNDIFYIFTYLIFLLYLIPLYFLIKKRVKKGIKNKSYAPLPLGIGSLIFIFAKIFGNYLRINFDNNFLVMIITFLWLSLTFYFAVFAIKDLIKYYYIKKLEIEEFYDSIENYELDKNF